MGKSPTVVADHDFTAILAQFMRASMSGSCDANAVKGLKDQGEKNKKPIDSEQSTNVPTATNPLLVVPTTPQTLPGSSQIAASARREADSQVEPAAGVPECASVTCEMDWKSLGTIVDSELELTTNLPGPTCIEPPGRLDVKAEEPSNPNQQTEASDLVPSPMGAPSISAEHAPEDKKKLFDRLVSSAVHKDKVPVTKKEEAAFSHAQVSEKRLPRSCPVTGELKSGPPAAPTIEAFESGQTTHENPNSPVAIKTLVAARLPIQQHLAEMGPTAGGPRTPIVNEHPQQTTQRTHEVSDGKSPADKKPPEGQTENKAGPLLPAALVSDSDRSIASLRSNSTLTPAAAVPASRDPAEPGVQLVVEHSPAPRMREELQPPIMTSGVHIAHLADSGGQSEMRIGLRTSAFGTVEVRAVVHDSQVGLAIGAERGELHRLFTNEVAGISQRLEQQDLRLDAVRFLEHGTTADAGSGSSADSRARDSHQHRAFATHVGPSDKSLNDQIGITNPNTEARRGLSVRA